ncbi:LysR family transcriptional regulator substrate-binding protein [Herbiconiux sp.]|uniref:LysR family transcriptional regulator substrate-binding protein n=1 Tax=Herbiconiux sp. TaxID=1871186 RepID=UPI0025C42FBE|nr:LysR family transcriptional regulator substrate-binding protein [Herbiconiux sp.]
MAFRVAFAPGVNPAKWFGLWNERQPSVPLEPMPLESLPTATGDAVELLRTDAADVALVRLPAPADDFRSIPLYTEQPVVVVPKDHEVSLVEQISLAELAELGRIDEAAGRPGIRLLEVASGATGGADAFELVSAGVGFAIVPKAVARLYGRRDVVSRDLVGEGAEAYEQRVALVWPADVQAGHPEAWTLVDEFIGIVRGRTANSTRGVETVEAIEAAKKLKPTAVAKAKAAEARAAKAAKGGTKKKPTQPGRTRPTSKGRRSR